MIVSQQVSFTSKLDISGQILEFFATLGTIADLTQTVLPDDFVRTDFVLLTFQS